ncbi:ferritin-like domain-containing protein [Roseobacter sp. CCS2]|uniref:ferritin-like domain-containing protein n=1 Tax=Roseobacter sp. CCS2 TaxID=391593 RepID=UPI0000F3C71C|nr:ferritin-like domain-containing protein [Roseobacter sp. CCS2]EBA11576.1 hypothetical protein RCCS2_16646 [Roseobacter sp. CCS2]
MRLDTLEDLYVEQLKDIYSANKQALDVTSEMVNAATDNNLGNALKAGVAGVKDTIAALEEIADRHDENVEGDVCKGMEGLVSEARAHALEQLFGEYATKDAMIITQYQRLMHYAIAGYGCLAAFADQLELDDDLTALTKCLNASYEGDRTMNLLATGRMNRDTSA